MELERKKTYWSLLDSFNYPKGDQKKMRRYYYPGKAQKARNDNLYIPIAANRFKYLIQGKHKSYTQSNPGDRKLYSAPEPLKTRSQSFWNTAANFYATKKFHRFRERPKRFDLIKHSNSPKINIPSIRTHLRPSEPTRTTVAPLIPQITLSRSSIAYLMLSGMFLLILAYLFHCWWYRKSKKLSSEYFPIPPSKLLVGSDHHSNHSELFSIPSSLPSEIESNVEASVIINLAEMDTLPLINLPPYNGFKLPPN
ncbi:hypothetical protein NPIL_659941 [Nephila pilipes]|uniref:Uncharacterized protein n=1 Tax=Nephila pilipes TaxID=299642 RepID=A0A8X6QQR7_NEPPI|nr:hypothetical protein NPIL_659941 [Nephila pilipes]